MSDFFKLSKDGKFAKILSDGKCSRTSPYAPTVGHAYARIIIALDIPSFTEQLYGRIECVHIRYAYHVAPCMAVVSRQP